MNKKLISIVVPAYNCQDYIGEAIESVKSQTYSNWELIIINDCSTDNTKNIISKYEQEDKRIILINLEKNSGAAKARNVGIEKALGNYIAFLDADDIWKEDKLIKQIEFMENNNYSFTFTGYEFASKDGLGTGKVVKVPQKINYKQALKNTTIFTSTVILDVNKLGKELISMINIRKGQDSATWWKILKTGINAYGLNENLSLYRRSENTLSSNKIKALRRTWNLYRKIEKLSVLKSSYYFCGYCFNAAKRRI